MIALDWTPLMESIMTQFFLLCSTEHNRKNWVIIDSVNGANASACLYSIVETAKANGLRPYNYFKYVLETITAHIGENDESYIDVLLPWSDKLPDECRIINISKVLLIS